METTKKDNGEKKKGFFAVLLESMTKTGGCCGNGESCGGGEPTPTKNQQDETQKDKQDESGKN